MEGKEKLNILILSWRGPGHPHEGGAEKSTHEHAKGWVKAGHRVTLFTSYFPGAKIDEMMDGVNIKRSGLQIFGVQLAAFKWYVFSNHEKFDLVVDQFHGIPFFTPLFAKTKKLAFIHEVTKEVWRLNPWPKPFNLIPAIFGPIFEPIIFRLFYKNIPFMTVSASTKKDLVDWGIPESNIDVIHNGLERPPIRKLPPQEKRKTLVYLGALANDKGIEETLKVFSYLNNLESDLQFWVMGKGEVHYQKYLELQTKKLGIYKLVKFWGFVSEDKKYELLAKAHLLINTSIREGWGLTVMEAASVGTPTVAYNVPGLRDSILNGKTGILVFNMKNLANEVLELMNNKEKYGVFRKNCLNWCKKFSWEKSVKMSLKLIENLTRT